jgi:hypothetical protein
MIDDRNGEGRTPSRGAAPPNLFEPDQDGARSGPPAGRQGADASPPPQVTSPHSTRQPSISSGWIWTLLLLVVVGLGVMATLGAVAALRGSDPIPAAAPPPAPAPSPAPVVDTETTQAGVPSAVQVPDGPAPDVGPFGIDGQALLVEVASHQVPLQQTDQQKLVDIGNRAVARDVPDLLADDPQIRSDLQATFPGWSEQNYLDATRCAAEYAERLIARNDGTVPPDSDDHHGGG